MRRMICSVQGTQPQEYYRIARLCNAAQGKSDKQKRATYFFMIPWWRTKGKTPKEAKEVGLYCDIWIDIEWENSGFIV